MKFSYNWLQEYIDAPMPPAHELARTLGLHSFELEGVEELDNGDYLLDWDILPNRSSDCLCYEGIAREIAAVCELPYKSYLSDIQEATGEKPSSSMIDFTLDTSLVTRATKRYAEGITVEESPEWLQERLAALGHKSINNVVDITNYVMLVTGQPMHAFDYDKLEGEGAPKQMSIRHAQEGEWVTVLTGEEYELDETMLVVADSAKALDIAGIKGGIASGVDEKTTRIVLSACNYDYHNIRTTSRSLRLATDASKRYENEVPLCKAERAMQLAAHLLESECGAQVSTEYIDITREEANQQQGEIMLTVAHSNSLLGLELSEEEIVVLLGRLGVVQASSGASGALCFTIPAERLDLQIAEDLIEEVGRLYGLEAIPELPIEEGFTMPTPNSIKQAWYQAGDALVQMGFYEVYNRSLVGEGKVALTNSLNSQAGMLRSNLLAGLTERVEKNFVHTSAPYLFEIGKVFTGIRDGVVDEHWAFAGCLGKQKIKEKQRQEVFLQTKGVLESVFAALSVRGVVWQQAGKTPDFSHACDDVVAVISHQEETIGVVGVNCWEIDFEKLVACIDTSVAYTRVSRYPSIERDVAVWVPLSISVREVEELIGQAGAEQQTDLVLFDVYEDVDNNRKSLGFRLHFQSWQETLTDDFVNTQMDKVYQALKSQKDFEIR